MNANIIGGGSDMAVLDQSKGATYYTRTVNGYFGSDRPATQVIKVREHGSGHVRIDLFVDGEFAGTWIKTAQHFANIIRWGSWAHVHVKAGVALARAHVDIPRNIRDVFAEALEKAVPEWIGSVKVKVKKKE